MAVETTDQGNIENGEEQSARRKKDRSQENRDNRRKTTSKGVEMKMYGIDDI